jgi:hypothetical protein
MRILTRRIYRLDFLRYSFPHIRLRAVRDFFEDNHRRLLPTYLAIQLPDLIELENLRISPIPHQNDDFDPSSIQQTFEKSQGDRRFALEEAIFIQSNLDRLVRAEAAARMAAEVEQNGESEKSGVIDLSLADEEAATPTAPKLECKCCWDHFVESEMVHCTSPDTPHVSISLFIFSPPSEISHLPWAARQGPC